MPAELYILEGTGIVYLVSKHWGYVMWTVIRVE